MGILMKNPKHLQGLSLTEIMVALVISSILMLGVISIMSSSKRTYALQNELAKLQDNARFIMEELTYNLRMAGYFGCSRRPPPGFSTQSIEGRDNQSIVDNKSKQPLTIEGLPPEMLRSDTLTITSLKEPLILQSTLAQLSAQPPVSITLAASSRVPAQNEEVIISDCGGSYIYTVLSNGPDPDSPSATILQLMPKPLPQVVNKTGNYNWPIEVYPAAISTVRYEVRGIDKNGDNDAEDVEDGFALFKVQLDSNGNTLNTEKLVEGVQNMQILYGIRDASGVFYKAASQPLVLAGQQIVSAQVTLLMRTSKKRFNILDATDKDFNLGHFTYNPQKNETNGIPYEVGYRHRLFTSTVVIRNE